VGCIYSADLLGAGLGALGVVLLLFFVPPLEALKILSVLGLVSAALLSPLRLVAVLVLIGIAILFPWTSLQISPYKGLSQTLQIYSGGKSKNPSSLRSRLKSQQHRFSA